MRRTLLLLLVVAAFVLPAPANLCLAQDAGRPPEEPGVIPDAPPDVLPENPHGDVTALAGTFITDAPVYDSGWVPLAQDQARTLIHNVGGNLGAYRVDMQYRSSGVDG